MPKTNTSRTVFQAAGEGTYKLYEDTATIFRFIGEVSSALWESVRKPAKVKWKETLYYMDISGSDALPIISLMGFLVGIILAFQAVVQLEKFGADSFVTDLVAITIVKELGPLIVAVIVAGRSGSAFAAEIGTMKVNDELDALVTMGFVPTRFVVVPKVLATIAIMPMLTIFSSIFGILGGMSITYFQLGISLPESYHRTIDVVEPSALFQGLVKSFVFGIIISAVGCMRGFEAKKDAQGVGRASTSAVVTGIFLIIIADALVTAIFSIR